MSMQTLYFNAINTNPYCLHAKTAIESCVDLFIRVYFAFCCSGESFCCGHTATCNTDTRFVKIVALNSSTQREQSVLHD